MPPSTLLRPLAVDLGAFAAPLLIGVAAFLIGRYFHRWSLFVRAMLIAITAVAVVAMWGLLFRVIPRPIDAAFSYIGGILVVLCWLVLGVIGFSWSNKSGSTDLLLRITLAILPLILIGIEASGGLWFRFESTEVWQNRPKSSGLMTQSTSMTCLPASAAMLLHQYGIEYVSEGECAYLANTSYFGTDANVMARALTRKINRRGVEARAISATFEKMVDRSTPFIAEVQLRERGRHAVLVTKASPFTVTWVDPLDGFPYDYPADYFTQVWNGTAIVIHGMAVPQSNAASKDGDAGTIKHTSSYR